MATSAELDPVFRQALKLLHSPSTDAAENIRKSLDEIIKQRHGPNKMLINTLSKKYLAEESQATGSGVLKPITTVRRQSNKSNDSNSNNSNPASVQITTVTVASGTAVGGTTAATVLTTDLSGQPQEIPVIISLPDAEGGATLTTVDDNAIDDTIMLHNQHLNDLEDLVCVVCRRIDLSAKNRLIECTKCNSLYHQECHTPQIADSDLNDDRELSWCCGTCKANSAKSTEASPAKSSSSPSSSSSSTNSNYNPVVTTLITTMPTVTPTVSNTVSTKKEKEHSSSKSKSSSSSSSSRHHHHRHHGHHSGSGSSSSSSSSKYDRSGSGTVTPTITIISADKRLQNMKKKAAKSHESKRKK